MNHSWFRYTWTRAHFVPEHVDWFQKPKRRTWLSRKVRPHRSYHACVLWHLQYLSTAVLCSTCPPQRGVVAKTLRHSISTRTHCLKHLAAAENNGTTTPKGSPVTSSRFGVQNGCGPFKGDRWPQKGEPNVRRGCTPVGPGHGGAKSGGPNPGYGFGTRKRSHPRRAKSGGAKSGEPNPAGQIWTTP